MNRAVKTVLSSSNATHSMKNVALFHSTTVLRRWGRSSSDSRSYSPQRPPSISKTLLRYVISATAEKLFRRWKSVREAVIRGFKGVETNKKLAPLAWGKSEHQYEYSSTGEESCKHQYEDSSTDEESCKCPWGYYSNGKTSYSENQNNKKHEYSYSNGRNSFSENQNNKQHEYSSSGFCSNGRNSFSESQNNKKHEYSSSGFYSKGRTSFSDNQNNEKHEYSSKNPCCLTPYRLELGLSPSGPLIKDDVKNAYRACAKKWHPDHHLGSSKAVAEEKFKACTVAYEYISYKLSLDQ